MLQMSQKLYEACSSKGTAMWQAYKDMIDYNIVLDIINWTTLNQGQWIHFWQRLIEKFQENSTQYINKAVFVLFILVYSKIAVGPT